MRQQIYIIFRLFNAAQLFIFHTIDESCLRKMSLFFNERTDEQQKKDPLKETITFTYPWIITLPRPNDLDDNGELEFHGMFRTNYKYHSQPWDLHLTRRSIYVFTFFHGSLRERNRVWNSSSCFISYSLYSDDDMKILLNSSPRIQMTDILPNQDCFVAPPEFVTKLMVACDEKKIARIVVLVELHLPSKNFCCPLVMPSWDLGRKKCDEVPANIDNDYRFQFLKESDFTIKCSNGLMPASRPMLHLASSFMKNWFKNSNDNELSIDHTIDFAKPVIIYLHTRCFQMPQIYDLDFAKRLLAVVDFFKPERWWRIKDAIELSLCQKFIIQEPNNFDTILQWISLAPRHSLYYLGHMIATVVVDKFYLKWQETFPHATRNAADPTFRDIFGSDDENQSEIFFKKIDDFKKDSFMTNVILD